MMHSFVKLEYLLSLFVIIASSISGRAKIDLAANVAVFLEQQSVTDIKHRYYTPHPLSPAFPYLGL